MKFLRKENIMCFRTKVSLIMLALFIGAGVFSMNVAPAEAASLAELQQIIEQLKAQIAELQARLTAVGQGEEDPGQWCHTFNTNLRIGDSGAEVRALRTALSTEGFSGLEAMGGAYEFDERLASAVVGFQEKYAKEVLSQWGLRHGTGFVGKSTRAKLNKLYGCGITPVPPTPAPPVIKDKPYCGAIGSKSEGWYQDTGADRPELIRWENCNGCIAVCRGIGTRSEGWHSSGSCETSGKLIKYDNCGEEPVPPIEKCTDTDGGINKYVKGTACRDLYSVDSSFSDLSTGATSVSRFCRTDRCIDEVSTGSTGLIKSYVTEYYCKYGKIFSKMIYCENGCYNGACKSDDTTCTDTDGGRNYYVKGNTIGHDGRTDQFYTGHNVWDKCLTDMERLTEWYCENNLIKSEVIKCSNGCRDGACIKEIEELTCAAKCQAKGYDTGICRSWSVVPDAEWGCKDNELNIGQTSDCYVPFGLVGASKTCCCQKETQEDCRDENYECTIKDIPCCPGLKEVGLCFEEGEECICASCGSICRPCGNGVCDANENKCNCPEDCVSGENLPPVIDGLTAPTQLKVNENGVWTIKARDPENGVLSYSVNWGDEYGKIALPESDSADPNTGVQTTTFTHSYSQVGIYTIKFIVTDDHQQTANTSASVNVVGSETICTDTDGGDNRYLKGKTTGSYYPTLGPNEISQAQGFGVIKTFTDYCKDNQTLREYYCVGNEVVSLSASCAYGCKDGACVMEQEQCAKEGEQVNRNPLMGPTDMQCCEGLVENRVSKSYSICQKPEPSITVISPNGGEQWIVGETYNITWNSNNVDKVMIQLDKGNPFEDGNIGWHIAYSVPASQGSYSWTLGDYATGDDYKIEIWDISNTSIKDYSDDYFSIKEHLNTIDNAIDCVANGYYWGPNGCYIGY